MKEMRTKPEFVRVTGAGMAESHVHDVTITKEAPNYRRNWVLSSGRKWTQKLQTTAKYDEAVLSFHEFAEKVSRGRELPVVVEEIYKLYYSENYESIYETYEKCCMKGTDEENSQAFSFFEKVFPELKVNEDGWYKTCTDEEEVPESDQAAA